MHEDNAPVTSVRFCPNGKFVLAWTLDACVRLWNYVEGRCVKTYQGHRNEKYSLSGTIVTYGGEDELTPKKAAVVSGSEDGKLVWWDVVNKEVLGTSEAHEGVALGVDTRGDGVIVSCGTDKVVRIWERELKEEEKEVDEVVDEMDVKEEDKLADVVANGLNGTHVDGSMINGVVKENMNADMDVDS